MTHGICEIINLQSQFPRRESTTGKGSKNSLHSGFKERQLSYKVLLVHISGYQRLYVLHQSGILTPHSFFFLIEV